MATAIDIQDILKNVGTFKIRGDMWTYSEEGFGEEVVYIDQLSMYAGQSSSTSSTDSTRVGRSSGGSGGSGNCSDIGSSNSSTASSISYGKPVLVDVEAMLESRIVR